MGWASYPSTSKIGAKSNAWDMKTGMVDATWPIAACDSPHGLAIDNQAHRLFATCVNSKLLVVNAATGAVVSTLAIGKRSDAAAFDGHLKRVFSSNGEGTLSVIQQGDSDRYKSLGNLPTQVGARTMTLDAESGRLYLVTGDYSEVDPSAKDPRKRKLCGEPGVDSGAVGGPCSLGAFVI